MTVRIQRTVYHVLSRIGHVKAEHTNRTNKIAHHLALTSDEIESFDDGPTAMFTDQSFWFSQWDSDPQTLPPDRLPDSYSEPVNGFSAWEEVFGDAGWAGMLGHAIASDFRSVSVIVPNGDQTMALLNEALQLVKAADQWKVCFSTFYTRQTSSAHCHWRFVMDGTSEARHLRARTQGILVDPLGSKTELPDDNPFVQAAREGRPDQAHAMAAAKIRRSGGGALSQPNGDDDEERPERPSVRRRREARLQKKAVQTRSPFDIPEEEYAHVTLEQADAGGSETKRKSSKRKNKAGLILVSVLLLAVIAILVVLGIKQLT